MISCFNVESQITHSGQVMSNVFEREGKVSSPMSGNDQKGTACGHNVVACQSDVVR